MPLRKRASACLRLAEENDQAPGARCARGVCGTGAGVVCAHAADAPLRVCDDLAVSLRTTPFILAARFCAGVALDANGIAKALGPCFEDGLLTTSYDKLGTEFRLPGGSLGNAAEAHGQPSLLCFASVKA